MTGDATDARKQRLSLPSFCSQHRHWAIPDTVRHAYTACGAKSDPFQGAIQLAPVSGWCDMGPFAVGCIGCAWAADSACSHNGVYSTECNKDSWLTQCVNWRKTEVWSVSSANLHERLSLSWIVAVNYWQCSELYVLNNGHVIGYGYFISAAAAHLLMCRATTFHNNQYHTVYIGCSTFTDV